MPSHPSPHMVETGRWWSRRIISTNGDYLEPAHLTDTGFRFFLDGPAGVKILLHQTPISFGYPNISTPVNALYSMTTTVLSPIRVMKCSLTISECARLLSSFCLLHKYPPCISTSRLTYNAAYVTLGVDGTSGVRPLNVDTGT